MAQPAPFDRLPLSADATLHYLGSFERDPVTVPITIRQAGDAIVVEVDDEAESAPLTLTPKRRDGTVRLYHVKDHGEYESDNLCFVKEEPHLKVGQWAHDGEWVETIECAPLYNVVTDVLTAERAARSVDATSAAEAADQTGVAIPDLTLEVIETTIRYGHGTSRHRKSIDAVQPVEDNDEWAVWKTALKRAGSAHETHLQGELHPPEGYEVGETLSLAAFIDDWYCLDAEAVCNRVRMQRLTPTDLIRGEFVRIHRAERDEPKLYVVSEIEAEADYGRFGPNAKLVLEDGHCWTKLTTIDGELRIGRGNYSYVTDVERLGLDADVSEAFATVQDSILDTVDLDAMCEDYELEVVAEKSWEKSSPVAEGGTDLEGSLTVDSPQFEEPVTVFCRNIFDAGFTATVRGDTSQLSEREEQMLRRYARENSPIPTGVRL